MRPDRAFLRAGADPAALPALLAFVVFVVLAAKSGGYSPTVWYPAALFLFALLTVSAWARRENVIALHPAGASVIFLAALTAWTYLSIAWSDVKGDAWDGANRGLLYLVVYALFVGFAWRAESIALIVGGYSLAIAILGVAELAAAARSANPDSYFLVARFAKPTGYQNANAALFSLALWPALFLASRRQVPIVVRALMLGASTALLELAVLSQSRGWLGAMPIVAVLYVALVPGRVRSIVFALPVALGFLAARRTLLDVFPALHSGEHISASVASARNAVLLSALVVLAVGAGMAVVDRFLWRGQLGRQLAFAGAAACAAVAAVGVVAGLVWLGNPVTRVERAWDQFEAKPSPRPSGSYFTAGFGSNRHDLYRVALHEIEHHPVQGVGSDNFAVDYLRERRTDEEPLYPHSIELKVVAQTGVVGGLLFLGFLVSAVLAVASRRDESPFSRSLRAVSLVGFAYWFVHGSIDWFWELPALGAPAFALLGIAVATSAPDPRRVVAGRRVRFSLAVPLAVVGAVAVIGTLVFPWLAAKEVEAAAHSWRASPQQAFQRLDRARSLNPLSDEPDLVAGAIASRIGNTPRMATSFVRALERNPHDWYAHLELGAAYANEGLRRQALAQLVIAHQLDPREPTIPLVERRVRRGLRVSTAALDETFLRRTFVSNRAPAK
jgi:O-antigen ligase/polysaccharide polymerase Wzy-like membrane protein